MTTVPESCKECGFRKKVCRKKSLARGSPYCKHILGIEKAKYNEWEIRELFRKLPLRYWKKQRAGAK